MVEIPEALIIYLILNCESNVELANLASVCQRWRDLIAETILALQQFRTNKLTHTTSRTKLIIDNTNKFKYASLETLLLPSMLRQLHLDQPGGNDDDSFCVAWFNGDGLVCQSVECHASQMRHTTQLRHGYTHNSMHSKLALSAWFGHRGAMNVLNFFGYSQEFVSMVLGEEAANQHNKLRSRFVKGNNNYGLQYSNSASSVEEMMIHLCNKNHTNNATTNHETNFLAEHTPTFAVRGSTIARPLNQRKLPRILKNTASNTKCIQFLDVKGTSAVRLTTDEFSCGTISQPVTIFVVGIATEDGCFISGLNRRFEVGHLYPDNYRDSVADRSRVCITASQKRSDGGSIEDGIDQLCILEKDSSDCSNSSGSSGSGSSSPHPSEIIRGRIGPGQWHLYTAIFKGVNSQIRVDGRIEASSDQNRFNCGNGLLDGLTIGSDHTFDMSLCDGGASEGEGEGSIAEVVVFKNLVNCSDIERMEEKLMKKFGIRKGSEEDISVDELSRQAHALISQPPGSWKGCTLKPVPLYIAARHKAVAWHRNDPVTGKEARVGRIGSKTSTGSSDW